MVMKSIVKDRDHRRSAVDPFEAERDIDQHSTQRVEHGQNRLDAATPRRSWGRPLRYQPYRSRYQGVGLLVLEYVQAPGSYSWYRTQVIQIANQSG